MVRGMKVVFQRCLVNCDGGTDKPGIAVHTINNGLELCCIGFLSQDLPNVIVTKRSDSDNDKSAAV